MRGHTAATHRVRTLLAAVLLTAGCSGDRTGDGLPDGEKLPRPVTYSSKALWTGAELGMAYVSGVELRGGDAIAIGLTSRQEPRLVVADAATGKVRWAWDSKAARGGTARDGMLPAPELHDLYARKPLIVGTDDDWSVVVNYTEAGDVGRGHGVAALSGKDGGMRWKRQTGSARPDLFPANDRTDGRTVLMGRDSGVTHAFDGVTGRELWTHSGGWGLRFAGGVVVGSTSPRSRSLDRPKGHVFALDARTGKARWDLAERFSRATLLAAAGDLVLVEVPKPPKGSQNENHRVRTLALDAGTGSEESSLDSDLGDCESDSESLIACAAGRQELTTYRTTGSHRAPVTVKVEGSDPTPYLLPAVDAVQNDRIHLAGPDRDRAPDGDYSTTDRAGNLLGSHLPGAPAAVSARYTAFFLPLPKDASLDKPTGYRRLVVHSAKEVAE